MMQSIPPMGKERVRNAELYLLKQLSKRLDKTNGVEPSDAQPTTSKAAAEPARSKICPVPDASQSASKNLLMTKVVVKGLVKACIDENISTYSLKFGVLDALIEEYRPKYPTLTKQMVTNGITKQKRLQQNELADADGEDEEKSDNEENGSSQSMEKTEDCDADHDFKVPRCMEIVDEQLDEYYEKIEALKRRRESAAANPEPPRGKGRPKKKRKSADDPRLDEEGNPIPKRGRGRPKGSTVRGAYNKGTPDNHLMSEITERYITERQRLGRLPKGVFESIVQETKKDLDMEDNALTLTQIRKRVTWNYMHRPEEEKTDGKKGYSPAAKKKQFEEEVYERYARMKKSNAGKVKAGALEQIIEGVKMEMGLTDDVKIKLNSLETKIQSRFTKNNPDFAVPLFKTLSKEDMHRRQLLMNEVVKRYVKAKGAAKKLAEGVLDQIIAQTKKEMGPLYQHFEIPKASIRGRTHRKSLEVLTLKDSSPYDAIDGALVETINAWLGQGLSVTRAQGLDFANTLLKAKNMETDENGNKILLDARWWRNFLERSKGKIVCS